MSFALGKFSGKKRRTDIMSERREKLEYLIKEYRDLENKLYIGNDFQTDVFDERKKILDEVGRIVSPRVDMILDFYKTLPKGEWCKSKAFSDWEFWCERGCKRFRPSWLSKNMMGFEWVKGDDDGYPETTYLEFMHELLLEDSDNEVKCMILQKAAYDVGVAKLSLDVLLEKETECRKILGVMLQNQRIDMNSTEKKR